MGTSLASVQNLHSYAKFILKHPDAKHNMILNLSNK